MSNLSLTLALALLAGSALGQSVADNPDGDIPAQTEYRDASTIEVPNADVPLGPTVDRGAAANFVFTGDLPEGDAPSDVVFTPDGSTIVIAHRESRNLILWDADTRAFVGEVPLSGRPQSLDITPDGSTAVVALLDTDQVSIVDLNTLSEVAVAPASDAPGMVKISPAGDVAAVSLTASSELAVVDVATGAVLRTVPDIGYIVRISFSPEPPAASLQYSEFYFIDNDRVLNVDGFANEAQIINVRTGAVKRLAIADNARDVSVSFDGSIAAISHTGSTRQVTILDLNSETIADTLPTPEDLFGEIALNGDGTKGVVAVLNKARVFDVASGSFGPQLDTASVNEFLTTSDGQYALGVGYYGAVIDFDSGSMVNQVNAAVSTEFGAVSPVDHRAAMCSTTFGDDLVVADTNGSAGGLEAFQLSGPLPEGDRCRTIAISPDGSVAAGVSILSDSLAVINTATNTVAHIASLGQRPSAVVITPDGSKAVVGNLDDDFATIVDLATGTSTDVTISTRAGAVAVSPDGHYAYLGVVASGDGVWRIDLTTNTVAGPKLLTGNMGGVGYSYWQNSGIAISHDGSVLAVAGSFTDNVTFIDTASWSIINNVSVPSGAFPTMVTFSDDDSTVFVSNRNSDSVSVIDVTGTPTLSSTFSVGDSPWQTVDAGNGRLWVNNWGDGAVALYDVASGSRIISFETPDTPVGIGLDRDANLLYVANGTATTTLGGDVGYSHTEDGRLTVIDATALEVSSTVELGYAPSALALDDSGNVAVVAAPEGDGAVVAHLGGPCNQADFVEPFGSLDFPDVQAFLQAFSDEDPAADIVADGSFDFFDVQAYLSLFSAGCP